MIDQEKFTELKTKYNIPQENNLSNSNFLYFILAKADIDITFLNEIDWKWLSYNFVKTHELLKNKKEIEEENINILAYEKFKVIYNKYSSIFASTPVELLVFNDSSNYWYHAIKPITSKLSSILFKIDTENNLSQTNIDHLKTYSLNEAQFNQLLDFLQLKKIYNILDHTSILPYIELYNVLKKIGNEQILTEEELLLITEHKILNNVLEKYNSQRQKYAEEFSQLKNKYDCSQYVDNLYEGSPLYEILKKLESGKNLTDQEINWLDNNKLQDTLEISKFIDLKIKYKVLDNQELSPKSHLYKVLKNIDSNIPLREQDINFLKKRNLLDLINTANQNYADSLINQIAQGIELNQSQSEWADKNPEFKVVMLGQIKDFDRLKEKYKVPNNNNELYDDQLYLILRKLESGKSSELEEINIKYLKDKNLCKRNTLISITYHTIEAKYYEEDYKKTGNKWKITDISSAWRKANEPEKALETTKNIDLEKIKNNELKSAILTTRGGALRDIYHLIRNDFKLDEAEKCARQAIELQPDNFRPYTLMGGIFLDRDDRIEAEEWFDEAEKRGASDNFDLEIKKFMQRMGDQEKRRQMAQELIEEDSERYDWARQYLKQPKPKKGKK